MDNISFEPLSFPILSINDKGKYKFIATSTLVSVDDGSLFLVNAAHTLKKDIHGNTLPFFIALPGKWPPTKLPFAFRSSEDGEDILDIAVTPLIGPFAERFLEFDSIPLHDDFPSEQFQDCEERIIFFGYPGSASRSSIDLKRGKIKTKPAIITIIEVKSISERLIKRHSVDFNLHILAGFKRNNMKNQSNIPIDATPCPKGISGGPVFKAYVEVNDDTHLDELKILEFIGIGTEYLENSSLLKATRKNAIYNFINSVFR
jgi:hypothetical protein